MKTWSLFAFVFALASTSAIGQQPLSEVALEQLLQTKINAALGQEATQNELSAWVGKDALRKKLELTLGASGFGLGLTIPHRDVPAPPPATLRTPPPKNIPCDPPIGCPSNCSDDCGHDTFLGKIVDPVCFTGCEARKLACEAANTAWKGQCEVLKAAYLGVMDKKLGEITFSDTSLDGNLVLSNFRLELDPELRKATLKGDLSGSGHVQGKMIMKPEPVVAVGTACAEYGGWLPPTEVQVQASNINLTATLAFVPVGDPAAGDRELQVLLNFDPIDVKAKVIGDPFIKIVTNDPTNFFKCTLPTLASIVVDAVTDHYDFDSSLSVPQIDPIRLTTVTVDNQLFAELTGTETTSQSIGMVATANHH